MPIVYVVKLWSTLIINMKKNRIDLVMVEKNICSSRQKAQALIMSGSVYIDQVKVLKPSEQVDYDDNILVRNTKAFVGRGAYKLDKAIKVFNVDVNNKVCIDVGAATGGFTDVLLQNGASKVYAIDVGFGQFDWKLRNDDRVVLFERTNARYLNKKMFDEKPSIAVMDVSFISIKLILPALVSIMTSSPSLYVLIKPQFEAGKDKVGKHGVVKDCKTHIEIIDDISLFLNKMNMSIVNLDYSPIKGPKGNIEYICEIKNSNDILTLDKIENVVKLAHIELNK